VNHNKQAEVAYGNQIIMEPQEDVVDTFLRYGLFIGAIFQLFCIGAVILMPDSKSALFHDPDLSDDEKSSDQGSPTVSPNHKHGKKRDKKKRR